MLFVFDMYVTFIVSYGSEVWEFDLVAVSWYIVRDTDSLSGVLNIYCHGDHQIIPQHISSGTSLLPVVYL